MELKDGDMVLIEPLSEEQKRQYPHGWGSGMDRYLGCITTITRFYYNDEYYLECDGHQDAWSSIHLKPISTHKIKLF